MLTKSIAPRIMNDRRQKNQRNEQAWVSPANDHFAGGRGTALADIPNASFPGPIAYVLVKFSSVRLKRLPLWLHEDAPWAVMARHTWQFTHSLLS
jgi:hypothetical protein